MKRSMDTETMNRDDTLLIYTKRYEDVRSQVVKHNETVLKKAFGFSILIRKGIIGWLNFWEQNLSLLKVTQSTIQEYHVSDQIKPKSLDISMIISNIIIYLSEKEGLQCLQN